MYQHPSNGGGEFIPQQNDPNSHLENSNKGPRIHEVNPSQPQSTPFSIPFPPIVQRPTIPVNRGTTHIFYKTRMCQKFLEGNCRNGDSCTFAHGSHDLREPPPNWQELVKDNNRGSGLGNWNDDQKIIHRMRICRKFYNGDECPYGDKCNFLHESPAKFKVEPPVPMDMGRTRESDVINIQPVVDRGQSQTETNCNGSDAVQVNTANGDQDAFRAPVKTTTYWKTRMCAKFEMTGQCMFADKCHFAHGQAELHTPVGRTEGEGYTQSYPFGGGSGAVNMVDSPITVALANGSAAAAPGEGRGFAKLRLKKLNRIYGDWIDDEDEQVD